MKSPSRRAAVPTLWGCSHDRHRGGPQPHQRDPDAARDHPAGGHRHRVSLGHAVRRPVAGRAVRRRHHGHGRRDRSGVEAAKKYLGVPYVFGGTNPATGLDCSGLVQRAYKDLGIELPRIAADQARQGTPVANLSQAKPGDLLAFNSPVDHIAIYVGNGKMIAAPQPGENVKIQDVYQTPSAIRRVIPDAPVAAVVRPASLQSTGSLSGVPYGDLFAQAGQKYGVSAKLLAAVAKVESNYNPNAVSPAGAQGLMQLMPSTAAGLGVNALNPAQAVDGAARLLSSHLKEFGSVPLALAAYNAGGGAVHKYGGIPPFAETQAYVPKVLHRYEELR
jgi:soluble lytic murein transglycosylase-like protein